MCWTERRARLKARHPQLVWWLEELLGGQTG